MEILPTSVADWLSEHLFVWLLKKVKNKVLRFFISLLIFLIFLAIGIGVALLLIVGFVMLLRFINERP